MESQVPKTMKEEQYDGSPQDLSVTDIKLEPVDEDLEYFDNSEYVMKKDSVESEALVESLCVPIKSEQDSGQMSEEMIKKENLHTIHVTEDMDSSGCAMKGEEDDAEALMTPLFVPFEVETYSEGTSEESAMEENLRAPENEDIQASTSKMTQYSEAESSVSETHKAVSAAGLNRVAVHINPQGTTKADEELSTRCLYHRRKSPKENLKKSTASSSSSIEKKVKRESRKEDGNQLGTFRRKSNSIGERLFVTQMKENRNRKEIKILFSKGSSSKQSKKQKDSRRSFCCNICGKYFHAASSLEDHERSHTGDKPFRCALCSKMCTTKGNLVMHMRVHSEERPHKCSACVKTFKRSTDLKRHVLIHRGEKTIECSECGKAFIQKSDLTNHMRSHTGERPYRCNQCGKAFSHCSNLNTHMRIHTGEKPYKCNECGKAFSLGHHLTAHKWVHTGERPFACSECESRFTTSRNLSRHRTRSHGAASPVSPGNA